MTKTERIGFAGIGAMGTPMAANLARAGYSVTVFDLDRQRCENLSNEQPSINIASSLAALGIESDLIITMLPDGKAVRTALCGKSDSFSDCLLETATANTLVIDMSSSSPLETCDLGKLLTARGYRFIDAPVSGGVKGAVAATLAIMVGGDLASFASVKPLLATMAGRVFHAGPLGAGHAIKALNNYVSAAGLVAASEALVAAQHFGIDPSVAIDIINASSGMNNTTVNKAKQFILSGTFNAGFATSLMAKDMRTALEVIESSPVQTNFARPSSGFWDTAEASLPAGTDHTAIYQLIEQDNKKR